MENASFSLSEKNQNLISWMERSFQNLTSLKNFISKSDALYFFQSKI